MCISTAAIVSDKEAWSRILTDTAVACPTPSDYAGNLFRVYISLYSLGGDKISYCSFEIAITA